jgi:hypothetical protein
VLWQEDRGQTFIICLFLYANKLIHRTMTYHVHPSIGRYDAILNNLPKTTGKSLEEWMDVLNKTCLPEHALRLDYLKSTHQLGRETAWLIAARSLGQALDISDSQTYLKNAAEYVEAMYSGKRAPLRPLHDRIIGTAQSLLGADLKICPCKTMVPLYRKHVFAQIKPGSNTRIDLGLALKNCTTPIPTRLLETGGLQKGDRITHRFALQVGQELDQELIDWLKLAYELDR